VHVVFKARLITCHQTAERQQNIVAGRLTLDAYSGGKKKQFQGPVQTAGK
jgi:hypothetical protein